VAVIGAKFVVAFGTPRFERGFAEFSALFDL
jgi:hypothetical protein